MPTAWKVTIGVIIGIVLTVIVVACFPKTVPTPKKNDDAKADVRVPPLRFAPEKKIKLNDKDITIFAINNAPKTEKLTVYRGTAPIDAKNGEEKWIRNGFTAVPNALDVQSAGQTVVTPTIQLGLEFLEKYTVYGNMLWDDKYLYVGAIIGDPNDVMRKNAAKIGNLDADITGLDRQSCVQLEICNRNLRENDDVTKLDPQGMKTYELTFWYSADENKACLVVKGKDSDASLVSKVLLHKGPEGFEAVIRRAGADCVLEAKIPWALIGGLPYKSMKTSWKVTWVDTRGNPSISGALIDVVAKKGDDFDAKDWQSNIAKWGTAELSPNPQP